MSWFGDCLCVNFTEMVFSTSWLQTSLSLNKEKYHGFLEDTSLPSFTFLISFFFFRYYGGRKWPFYLEKQRRIRKKHKVKHSCASWVWQLRPAITLYCAAQVWTWSEAAVQGEGKSSIWKALGHHFPSTWSTNTWIIPVDKAPTKEVRDQGSNTHLSPRRLFSLPDCGSILSGAIPPSESVLLCSQTQKRWQDNKPCYGLASRTQTWMGQDNTKHKCKLK